MSLTHEHSWTRAVKAMRAWLVLLLAMFLALQLSSVAALVLLQRFKHITYDPMPVNSIGPSQRKMLDGLLAGETRFLVYSPLFGWTAKPNGRTLLYHNNSAAIRGEREYTHAPLDGVLRIATFGDSFVYGADVKNEDSWQEAMMREHRNVEVLNFGVSGFGTDQAFLRYRHDGAVYKPDIVVIGFYTDNISRNVSVYRPFYSSQTDIPMAKPRFLLEGGMLVLQPNPMSSLRQYEALLDNPARVLPLLGRHDYFYQSTYHPGRLAVLPSVRLFQIIRARLLERRTAIETNGYYNVNSEAFKVTEAIFDDFTESVRQAGSVPVILVLPGPWDIGRYRREGTRVYAPLVDYFRSKGYRYLDMLERFQEYSKTYGVAELAPSHYSPLGNRLVAEALWRFLADKRLVDPKALRSR